MAIKNNSQQSKMLADESEPSIFCDFDKNTSTSSDSLSIDEDPINTNSNLQRKTSISLYNVSSTPYNNHEIKKCRFRTASNHTVVDSDFKTKRKKYDHVQSKVKQYRMEIKKQTKQQRELRKKQEEEQLKELENNLLKSTSSTNEETKNYLSKLSPIVHSNDENESIKISNEEYNELKEQYNIALNEIDSLQIEIMKLKASKSVLASRTRKKSFQSSMIKTCLFKNSSSTLRQNNQQNVTKSSLFGSDSTCLTIDIEDALSPEVKKNNSEYLIVENDPFVVKTDSQLSETTINSSVPLLYNYTDNITNATKSNSFYGFINNFIKCPTMRFLYKLKSNKIKPIPKIFIVTPKSDQTGDYELNQRQNKSKDIIFCTKQEILLKEMSDCCEELTVKLNRFKSLTKNYAEMQNNNNI